MDLKNVRKFIINITYSLYNNLTNIKITRFIGAGEGIRTLDFNLGKVAEYFGAWPSNHFLVSVFSLSKFIFIMRIVGIKEIKVATESPKIRCKQIINL